MTAGDALGEAPAEGEAPGVEFVDEVASLGVLDWRKATNPTPPAISARTATAAITTMVRLDEEAGACGIHGGEIDPPAGAE